MAIQRWWEEFEHGLFYHRRDDEAYMRHHFREEVERNLRDIIRGQRAQMAMQAAIGRAQIEAIEEQTEAIERGFEQLGRGISDLAETISWSVSAVADAVESLERTMSWGFAQVIWQQEQTNELLLNILKRLSSPRTTEAEELRERGNEFYRNGVNSKRPEDRERWMNLAIDAYLESVRKNPADFSVFHSLGVIMFFEKGNSDLALRCFREAAALAEPYSPYHSAMSWLHLGYVHRNREEFEEAYQATAEAIKLRPEWLEAHYQHAVHCALTGRLDEMRKHLAKAIEGDETYFPKAATDPDLLPFRADVGKVVDELMPKLKDEAEAFKNKLLRWREVVTNLPSHTKQILNLLQGAIEAIEKAQGYVALRQAIRQAKDAITQVSRQVLSHQTLIGHIEGVSLVRTLEGHTGPVFSVSFSPDGQILASGSLDNTIKLWRVSDGSLIRTLEGHTFWVNSVSFSPDGQILASGSGDKTIKLWRVSDGSLIRTLEGHTFWVSSVSFSPDGQILASGSDDKTIKLWRVSDGSLIRTLEEHTWMVRSVTFSPDGQILASGSDDNTIKLWRVSDGSLIRTLTGHTDTVCSVSFSPNGQILASGSSDKTIKLWNVSLLLFKWRDKASLSEAEIDQLLQDLEQWQAEMKRRLQEEEERRRMEEERRRMEVLRAQRRAQGLCEDCGRPLSFWDKLLGRTKCPNCR